MTPNARLAAVLVGLVVIAILLFLGFRWWNSESPEPELVSFDLFVSQLKSESPVIVEIGPRDIIATYSEDRKIRTEREASGDVLDTLKEFGISRLDLGETQWFYRNDPAESSSQLWNIIIIVAIVFIVASILRRQNQKSNEDQFAKNEAKTLSLAVSTSKPAVTWDQIAGATEAIETLKEAASVFLDPERAKEFGVRQRRGILLTGPPGTGKTLLARAMANAVDAEFKQISASSFVRLYTGAGPARIREFFESMGEDRTVAFIDEIDAVGKRRDATEFNQEREQTLNELLNQMDGYESKTHILVLGATNLPESLDSALLRQGRFDRIIRVPLPNYAARFDLFKIHLAKVPIIETIDDSVLWGFAKDTEGLSGADIEGVINEACTRAFHSKSDSVSEEQIRDAIGTVNKMGAIRRKAMNLD